MGLASTGSPRIPSWQLACIGTDSTRHVTLVTHLVGRSVCCVTRMVSSLHPMECSVRDIVVPVPMYSVFEGCRDRQV
jgi:hypothetical protein